MNDLKKIFKTTIILIFILLFLNINVFCESKKKVKKSSKPDVSDTISQLKSQLEVITQELNKIKKESEVRNSLISTNKEEEENEKEILSAAGRDYSLGTPGVIGFEYNFSFSTNTYDSLVEDPFKIEYNSDQSMYNSFVLEAPVLKNLTFNTSFPIVNKVDSQSNQEDVEVSDLGDMSVGCLYQPFKSGNGFPSIILRMSGGLPTGRSPYKIDLNNSKDLATGSGYYSLTTGVSISKPVDPVFLFGGMSFTRNFQVDDLNSKTGTQGESGFYLTKVIPGNVYSFNLGMAFSLSYKVSINFGYSISFIDKSKYIYTSGPVETERGIRSTLSIGTGWNITPKRNISFSLGIGLTNNDSDFSFSVRIPFKFDIRSKKVLQLTEEKKNE